MVGGSYGGQIQFATAAVDSRVDTLVPLITWNDLRYALAPNNTSLTAGTTYASSNPGTEKIGWTGSSFGVGITDGVTGATIDPRRNVAARTSCSRRARPRRPSTAWATRPRTRIGSPTGCRWPTTSIGSGLTCRGGSILLARTHALATPPESAGAYRGRRRIAAWRGVPVAMAWQSWGHSGGSTALRSRPRHELDLSGQDIEGTYLGSRIKNWFDHYLKGHQGATGPEFAYFRDWVSYTGSAAPAYATAGSYPVPGRQTWYLSAADELVPRGRRSSRGRPAGPTRAAGASRRTRRSRSGRAGGPAEGVRTPFDTPGTFGAWTTPCPDDGHHDRGLTDSGRSLRVAGGRRDAERRAGRSPAGLRQDVRRRADGAQTLVHKLISPVRVADVTQSVHIELPGIVHRVEAGHRIRLVLASTTRPTRTRMPCSR